MNVDEIGAVIGRFQIDDLHVGHSALLDYVTARHRRVVILVGVRAINPDSKHPLSFEVRRNMLQKSYPTALILPVEDCKHDEVWSHNVDKLLRIAMGEYPIHFYTGRDGFGKSYSGRHKVEIVTGLLPESNATERRELIRTSATEFDSVAFRAGIIHGVLNRYPTVETTVDMAVLQDADSGVELLLGRKEGEKEWRLPGGFVNGPEQLEVSATREIAEETGLSVDPTNWEYIKCDIVNDWRVEGTPDHFIRTFLFVSYNGHFGVLKAGDDLAEITWSRLHDVVDGDIVKEHRKLIRAIIVHCNSRPTERVEK